MKIYAKTVDCMSKKTGKAYQKLVVTVYDDNGNQVSHEYFVGVIHNSETNRNGLVYITDCSKKEN